MLAAFDKGKPHGPGFGLFCFIAALALAAQAHITYRKGYMYCGRTQVVYRKDHPKKFAFFVGMHLFCVIMLVGFSLFGFFS
jgi:hypothetical protein